MEKRFVAFLVLSALIIFTHLMIQNTLAPKPPVADNELEEPADGPGDKPPTDPKIGGDTPKKTADEPETPQDGQGKETPPPPKNGEATTADRPVVENRRLTMGSAAPDSPYRLLVTLNNRGAAIERIELTQRKRSGKYRYRELDFSSGYLGLHPVSLIDEAGGKGCRITVVGPGTPADLAGLKVGDVIVELSRQPIPDKFAFMDFMQRTKPDDEIEIAVRRRVSGKDQQITSTAKLTEHPLGIVDPELNPDTELAEAKLDPLSCLLSLHSVGDIRVERGKTEIAGLPSLRNENWAHEVKQDDKGPMIEFRFPLSEAELAGIGVPGAFEIVKRYRLAATPADELKNSNFKSYHLELELEIHNLGNQPQDVAFRLDGPNGLPLEGWWYSNKIHPRMFRGAGARDVVWQTPRVGHKLMECSAIYKEAKEEKKQNQPIGTPLFAEGKPEAIDYIGVDTQYFNVALLPQIDDDPSKAIYAHAIAAPAGPIGEKTGVKVKTSNSSFRLISQPETVAPGNDGALRRTFTLFAGPKQPELLAEYGLDRAIEYGWFPWIAKPLSGVLHFFESLPLVNYGIAIILLTVLVRGCMFPISRKAAKNAQMMQELAPEMKAIAEKYKNDMEKRSVAQRELFKKHNYNPFGGCLLMFFQLPIFIGLYRALSVDIELRQAALIPGVEWCSNLAGPDKLLYWKNFMPGFFADETGWLGPYLNVLPIVTIFLFLLQQKMFMPPATDDQTRMQQSMMKYMMIFMGVLFFKVPSGLCVYFVASSLWGIAERKLLPPIGKQNAAAASKSPSKADKPSLLAMLTKNGEKTKLDPKERAKRRQKKR